MCCSVIQSKPFRPEDFSYQYANNAMTKHNLNPIEFTREGDVVQSNTRSLFGYLTIIFFLVNIITYFLSSILGNVYQLQQGSSTVSTPAPNVINFHEVLNSISQFLEAEDEMKDEAVFKEEHTDKNQTLSVETRTLPADNEKDNTTSYEMHNTSTTTVPPDKSTTTTTPLLVTSELTTSKSSTSTTTEVSTKNQEQEIMEDLDSAENLLQNLLKDKESLWALEGKEKEKLMEALSQQRLRLMGYTSTTSSPSSSSSTTKSTFKPDIKKDNTHEDIDKVNDQAVSNSANIFTFKRPVSLYDITRRPNVWTFTEMPEVKDTSNDNENHSRVSRSSHESNIGTNFPFMGFLAVLLIVLHGLVLIHQHTTRLSLKDEHEQTDPIFGSSDNLDLKLMKTLEEFANKLETDDNTPIAPLNSTKTVSDINKNQQMFKTSTPSPSPTTIATTSFFPTSDFIGITDQETTTQKLITIISPTLEPIESTLSTSTESRNTYSTVVGNEIERDKSTHSGSNLNLAQALSKGVSDDSKTWVVFSAQKSDEEAASSATKSRVTSVISVKNGRLTKKTIRDEDSLKSDKKMAVINELLRKTGTDVEDIKTGKKELWQLLG